MLGLLSQMMFELNANYLCLKFPFVLERTVLFVLTSCSVYLSTVTDVCPDSQLWESVRMLKAVPFALIEQVSLSMALSLQSLIM